MKSCAFSASSPLASTPRQSIGFREAWRADKIPSNLRILVVEDEAIIAMLIEDMLSDLGCVSVGPAYSTEQALELIQSEQFDAAILDVNLGGQRTTPVAQALLSRGIPFVFATGYGPAGIAEDFSENIVLTKPFEQIELECALKRLFSSSEKAQG